MSISPRAAGKCPCCWRPGRFPIVPSPSPCRPSAPRRSCTAWSRPSASSAACRARCGGTIRRRWRRICSRAGGGINERYRRPGQPLPLRAAVLHGAATAGEAARRRARAILAAGLGHAGAAVKDLAELNAHLRGLLPARSRAHPGNQTESIGQRFERDRAAGVAVAAAAVRCVHRATGQGGQVSDRALRPQPLQRAALCAFRTVTVKGYVDHIEVVAGDQVIARHPRSYEHGRANPRSAALSGEYWAASRRRWIMPTCSGTGSCRRCSTSCGTTWKQQHGGPSGGRQYIRVLQLLAEHPVSACSVPSR